MRLLTTILLFWSFATSAQTPFSKDIWINDIGTHIRVNDIATDGNAGFWLATDHGLLSFNGRTATTSGEHRNVTTLIKTGAGLIYGCRDGSVYKFSKGQANLLLKSSFPILCLQPCSYGILAGTEGDGIYLLNPNIPPIHFSIATGVPDDYIYTIAHNEHEFFIGTDLDFFKGYPVKNKGLHFEEVQHFGDITRVIRQSLQDQNKIWIGFQERGIALLEKDRGQNTERVLVFNEGKWRWGQVNDILSIEGSKAWITTEAGWLLYATNNNDQLVVDTILNLKRPISSITQDALGNLWLGTTHGLTQVMTGGIYKLPVGKNFKLQQFTAARYVPGRGLYYNQDNQLWRYEPQTGRNKLLHTWETPVNCLYADDSGTVWVGTSGSGLWISNAVDGFSQVNIFKGISSAYFLNISGDGNRIWLSTLNGVDELSLSGKGPELVAHYGKNNGIGSDIVYQIFVDSKKRIWLGTDGAGISVYENGRWRGWDKKHGFKSGVVYAITEDAKGYIWAATLDDGLFCYDNQQWKRFTRKHGLQSETINDLEADASGRVYAASGRGIDIWYPAANSFRHINRRTAPGIDSFSTALNILTHTSGGDIIAPCESGFMLFKNEYPGADIQPGLKITAADLFFKPLKTLPSQLNYDQDHITFKFQGINLAHSERLHYRYRLLGHNNDWISTSDETVTYPRLSPGKYKFQIQASPDESFSHPAQASWSFMIVPPFWQTSWFLVLIALLISVCIYTFLRWRIHTVKQIAAIKQERVMFEYEHLKSQVNPHFLFNSLNTLAALIEEQPAAAVTYTEQLSELYRDSLAGHQEKLITIAEECKMLNRYYHIQHTRFGDAFVLKDRLTDELKARARVVPLALQLLVENALKHNIVSRHMPLVVCIETDGQSIVVRNTIQYKKHKEKSMGIGLKNIRRRYSLVTSVPVETIIINNEFIVKLPLIV